MESLSIVHSSSPPIQNHPKPLKSKPNSPQTYFCLPKASSLKTSLLSKSSLSFTTLHFFTSFPCLATETLSFPDEQKINLESILVSIDDFFNRYPFFVAGCTFIWLFVIPVTQEYLRKYKFISAIDAFRKLRDSPDVHLLDIRDKKSLVALGSPNLKILSKSVVQVEFSENDEDGFVKSVKEKFQDPANTSLCVLDNFDGNSLRVAELLFKNGFKEAYAIRGGIRGQKGWLAIQDTLLPPSVHIYPKRKKKKKAKISAVGVNGGIAQQIEDKNDSSSSTNPAGESQKVDNGHVNMSMTSTPHVKIECRSPYPNYPDLKPPSSPTPSKP